MQFDNEYFDKCLDGHAAKAMDKITNGEKYEQIDVMLLVLKSQTNHIAHMEQERHGEMRALRDDMDERFDKVDERLDKIDEHLERVDKHLDKLDMQIKRMDLRMDSFEPRAQAADKRFYNFMIWFFSRLCWSAA